MPQYTNFGGLQAGTAQSRNFGTLTSGQSITYQIRLTVLSTAAVPEGASITLNLFDLVRGASISRTVVTRDVPALGLALSTAQIIGPTGREFHLHARCSQYQRRQCPECYADGCNT